MSVQDAIVIVSGLPRSGTSMMMQMLDAGGVPILTDGVREADSDNPQGYYEFEPVKRTREDPSWLAGAPGKAVKMVHLLLKTLPVDRTYRVIVMRRELDEVLASQAVMLERLGRPGASLSPDRLAAVFRRQLEDVTRWMAEQDCFESIEVEHGRVISHPDEQAERVSAFLGGHLDVSAMANVVNPTLHRQRGPTA